MTPRGFWSYARGDDEHLDNVLTRLRNRVAGEISMLLGQDIGMFQDIYDIRTGDDWKERLRSELTDASFMVPVLTPRYFTRPWCREEVLTFLGLAEEEGREPLLFPIYFVEDSAFDEGDYCDVRAAISRFQHFNYQPYRFESDPTRLDHAVYKFAKDIRDRLRAGQPAELMPEVSSSMYDLESVPETMVAEAAEDATPWHPEVQPREVPTLVVDPWPNRADHTTIAAAIKAAEPGGRIIVRPGMYEESLVLDKALELIGDGGNGEVVVRSLSEDTLLIATEIAEIANITFLHEAIDTDGTALKIEKGNTKLHDCRFCSKTLSAAEVSGISTRVLFQRCSFEKSHKSGCYITNKSSVELVQCVLQENDVFGVEVSRSSTVNIRKSLLKKNSQAGVCIYKDARAILVESDIKFSGKFGAIVRRRGQIFMDDCLIHGHTDVGVLIKELGGGKISGNIFGENKNGEFRISDDCIENVLT